MAAQKPTKQQVAQAKARAGGNNPIKVTDAGLKKLGKAAVTAATFVPAGRAVKVAVTAAKAVKAGSAARATARGLKAAQGPSLAKGAAKTAASSGKYERNIANITAKANMQKGLSKKESYAKAAKTMDARNSISVNESKKILARAAAEKKAAAISKNLKNTKPMENVPKGVSSRFNDTVKRLAAEEAKKKKK
jgi:hypothetical protein